MTIAKPAHKRILLKLSGEALMGDDQFGINRATIVRMVNEIAEVTRLGVQVAVVIGGGNIFRGVAGGAVGMDRATADYMGMLATVMNSLALADTMEKRGSQPASCRPLPLSRWSSHMFVPRHFSTLKKAKWSSLQQARATPSSQPTPLPLCVVPKLGLSWFSKPPRSMAFTRPIPN